MRPGLPSALVPHGFRGAASAEPAARRGGYARRRRAPFGGSSQPLSVNSPREEPNPSERQSSVPNRPYVHAPFACPGGCRGRRVVRSVQASCCMCPARGGKREKQRCQKAPVKTARIDERGRCRVAVVNGLVAKGCCESRVRGLPVRSRVRGPNVRDRKALTLTLASRRIDRNRFYVYFGIEVLKNRTESSRLLRLNRPSRGKVDEFPGSAVCQHEPTITC